MFWSTAPVDINITALAASSDYLNIIFGCVIMIYDLLRCSGCFACSPGAKFVQSIFVLICFQDAIS